MSASSVPVPTGDLAQLAATESAGGSAFDSTLDEDVELRLQMDRDEHLQGSLPEAVDEVPQGGGNGDDDEYDLYGQNGWSGGPDMTADSAHAEFIRATGHFVSEIGYDVLSPQDPPDAPGAASSGPQYSPPPPPPAGGDMDDYDDDEDPLLAFARFTAHGASTIGYDGPSPAAAPEAVPSSYAYVAAAAGGAAAVEMNDSSKRGRETHVAPSPAVSGELRAAKRTAPPAPPMPLLGRPVPPAPPMPLFTDPSHDEQIRRLKGEVESLQLICQQHHAELDSVNAARRVDEQHASQAIAAARRDEQTAAASLGRARADTSRYYEGKMEEFKVQVAQQHEQQLKDMNMSLEAKVVEHRSADRSAAEAFYERKFDDLRMEAEARHAAATAQQAAGFAEKERAYAGVVEQCKAHCVTVHATAVAQRQAFEQEKSQLQGKILELTVAATTAGLGPLGGLPGDTPETQQRLDSAIGLLDQLKNQVLERDVALAKFTSALRDSRDNNTKLENTYQAFKAFVVPREKGLRFQIEQLEQQAFLTNGQESNDTVALNVANVKCSALDEQVLILRAQLSAATAQVVRFRSSGPPAAPAAPPAAAAPCIRHPSLHSGAGPTLSAAQGGVGGYLSAHSQEEWYAEGAPPVANLQSLNHSTQYFNMCGGKGGNAPGVAPLSFNYIPPTLGPRPPRPAEDPARFDTRPGAVPTNLLQLGPRQAQPGPKEFFPQLSPPAPTQAPPRDTMYQQQGPQPTYQYAPGFKSMVSEISFSEAPPNPADAESSEYESDVEDDPNAGTAVNLARRQKANRQWRMYREFNGVLTIAPIPDHASKFKEWKNIVRADICQVSKAGQKTFNWICKVEDNRVPDDALRVSKKKWEALDSKLRAALLKVAHGDIANTFALLTEEERVQHGRQISGAFMLRLIYRRFQTKDSLAQYYDFNDLTKVAFKADHLLESFLNDWKSKLNGMENPAYLMPSAKLEMFLRQLKGSALMKWDLDLFKRMPKDDPAQSYNWLLNCVEDRIREQRNAKVEAQLHHGGGAPPALPAPAGTLCVYFNNKGCKKGDLCDMVHDPKARATFQAHEKVKAAEGGGGNSKPEAKTKGTGKGKVKTAAGPGTGKIVGMKGGNPKSQYPCYDNAYVSGGCVSNECRHCHRALTADEKVAYQAWKLKNPTRAASPGAPAPGVCPEFLKGSCLLGADCNMEHAESKGAKKRAAAAAKAAGR